MCRYLGITRSSYYRWLKHPKSDNEIRNEQIADIIREIHRLHPDMGYRRIRDELAVNYGIPANDKRILRICRKTRNTVIYQMEAEELYESRQESLPHCEKLSSPGVSRR